MDCLGSDRPGWLPGPVASLLWDLRDCDLGLFMETVETVAVATSRSCVRVKRNDACIALSTVQGTFKAFSKCPLLLLLLEQRAQGFYIVRWSLIYLFLWDARIPVLTHRSLSFHTWEQGVVYQVLFIYLIFFKKCILWTYSWFTKLYQFLLSSKMIQLYTYVCVCVCSFSCSFFYCGLLRVIEYSSLCCRIGLCCLHLLGIESD